MMSLATTRFTQALIDLEDAEPDVLFEMLPGAVVPLWPQVRMGLAYALSAEEFTSVAVAGEGSLVAALARAGRAVLPSRQDARTLRGARPLVFVAGGTTVAATQEGEKNWLIGDYAASFPGSSAILQWQPLRGRARPAFRPTRTLDPLIARSEVRSRLRPPPSGESQIRKLVREFARLLGGVREEPLESVIAGAVYGARIASALEREIDVVLDRLRPQLVVFEGPVDGGWGAVVAAMKARGAHVAEPQHGWIGPGHGAYNFGAAMRRPELNVAIPDELLTFGRFWSENVRFLGEVTTIGKPQFERAVATAPTLDARPREILVVSSVGEPERASRFVLALAGALPHGWKVRFRPHPSERSAQAQRYSNLAGVRGVVIDPPGDIYESLATARIVVGVASTVLFEAAGMGCQVFVRDTPYVPYIVGNLFGPPLGDDDGIDRLVAAAEVGGMPAQSGASGDSRFWEPNAVENFRDWVTRRVANLGQFEP